jgi:hypothetical protein
VLKKEKKKARFMNLQRIQRKSMILSLLTRQVKRKINIEVQSKRPLDKVQHNVYTLIQSQIKNFYLKKFLTDNRSDKHDDSLGDESHFNPVPRVLRTQNSYEDDLEIPRELAMLGDDQEIIFSEEIPLEVRDAMEQAMKKRREVSDTDSQIILIKNESQQAAVIEQMFKGIHENNIQLLEDILSRYHGIKDTGRDSEGNSLLSAAACVGNSRILRLLLMQGFDPNMSNLNGDTPLHFAMKQRNFNVVDILVQHGANESIQNNQGLTPWECLP